MPKRSKRELREERFAHEYVIDLNGEQAAIRAGYSEKTARAQASRLLTKSNVQALIAELTKAKCEKLEISAEWVLGELRKLAGSNMLDYLSKAEDGSLYLDFSKLTREQAAAIQEIREDATGGTGDGERKKVLRTTFKLADKRGSLELLGKYLKLFTDKVELSPSNELVALIAEGRKRAATQK